MKKMVACMIALVMVLQGSVILTGTSYGAESTTTDRPNYADNQLVVSFGDDVSKATAADIVAFAVSEELISENNRTATKKISDIKSGVKLTKIKSDQNLMLVELNVALDEEATAKELQHNPDVKAAQPNYYYTAADGSVSGETYDDDQWYLDYIDAPEAWKLIKTQKEKGKIKSDKTPIIIASLDSGILQSHEDLQKNTQIAVSSLKGSQPQNSYGTKMAGIVAATANNEKGVTGIAAGAGNDVIQLLSIDVFHDEKKDTVKSAATTYDIITGLDYASRHNAKIVTMAFGRHGYDKALEGKINWAADQGMLLIAAAGDNGNAEPWYPSDYSQCISCIGVDKYTDAYSTDCKSEQSDYGNKKNISAPGTSVRTTNLSGAYSQESGTAYSTAVVAGAAALVMYADPSLSASQVRSILYHTAGDLGVRGEDEYTGHGIVNAYRAVAKAAGVKVKDDRKKLGSTSVSAKAAEEAITLQWKPVKEAQVYVIFRKGQNDKDYTQVATVSKDKATWTDKTCQAERNYSYKVVAGATTKDGKKLSGKSSNAVTVKALKRKD